MCARCGRPRRSWSAGPGSRSGLSLEARFSHGCARPLSAAALAREFTSRLRRRSLSHASESSPTIRASLDHAHAKFPKDRMTRRHRLAPLDLSQSPGSVPRSAHACLPRLLLSSDACARDVARHSRALTKPDDFARFPAFAPIHLRACCVGVGWTHACTSDSDDDDKNDCEDVHSGDDNDVERDDDDYRLDQDDDDGTPTAVMMAAMMQLAASIRRRTSLDPRPSRPELSNNRFGQICVCDLPCGRVLKTMGIVLLDVPRITASKSTCT